MQIIKVCGTCKHYHEYDNGFCECVGERVNPEDVTCYHYEDFEESEE